MKRLFSVPFRPLTLLLSGVGIVTVGGILAEHAYDDNDPRMLAAGSLVLFGALLWLLSMAIATVRLVRRIRRKKTSVPTLPLRRGRHLLIALILAVVLTGAATLFAALFGPAVDARTLADASPAMVQLADEAGMSRQGKLIFLRTQPQLVSDTEMQSACAENTAANNSNGFIEQGCYAPSTNKIYLRQMPSDLHSLVVATAAYEMLHPVYIALHKSGQSAALDAAIEANFTAINDTNLNTQVANFADTEPGARDLELFSLLGAGYNNLNSDLAHFYAPYFDNIGATVNANTQVKQLFKSSEDQLATLDAQIKRYDNLANGAYATSVRWAHAGDQSLDDYYYNQYLRYLDQENTSIDAYNLQLKNYNALVTEFNGTQPVQAINPAQAQAL